MAYRRIAALAAVLGLSLAGCSGMSGGRDHAQRAASPRHNLTTPHPAADAMTASPTARRPRFLRSLGAQSVSAGQPLAIGPRAAPAGKHQNPANANAINAVNALSAPLKTYNDETSNEPGSNARRKSHPTGFPLR